MDDTKEYSASYTYHTRRKDEQNCTDFKKMNGVSIRKHIEIQPSKRKILEDVLMDNGDGTKRRKKKKKLNKLKSKGSIASSEETVIVGRNSEHIKGIEHNVLNNDHGVTNERYTVDDNGLGLKTKLHAEAESENNATKDSQARNKRKKKRKVLDLKKTSSKVGILNQAVLPPIAADEVKEAAIVYSRNVNGEVPTSERKDVGFSGSTSSLVSSSKDSSSNSEFQKPLRFCVWITRYPLVSFCK